MVTKAESAIVWQENPGEEADAAITVGPAVPAQFAGRVVGDVASITVTVNDTVQHQTVVKAPVTVTLGQQPQLGPCPICKR